MAELVSQQNVYEQSQTDNVTGQMDEDHGHNEHLSLQECMQHPIAFHAEMMEDTMYLNQALQQPDAAHFVEAVVQEVNGHIDNNHWRLTKRSKVPPDVAVPSVCTLWCKRDITTNKIKKYNARLNLHGGKQVFGLNYYETYALVVTWFSTSLLIVIGIIFCWALYQVDFIMAYPQAPIVCNMYMELPQGIQVSEGNSKDYVLKLKNIYGQKQASCMWDEYLVGTLSSIGFKASLIDDCVFYQDNINFMIYVDNGIFLGKDNNQLKQGI